MPTTQSRSAAAPPPGSSPRIPTPPTSDGTTGEATATIIATDGHPFWLQSEHRWTDAKDLHRGAWLRTSAGTYVQVTAVRAHTAHQRVHNLTVADIHTYYVVTGGTPVLVHNCGTATVRWDVDLGHATIRVESKGKSLETEQVIPGWNGVGSPSGLPTTGARPHNPSARTS